MASGSNFMEGKRVFLSGERPVTRGCLMNILLFGATGMVGDGVLRRLIASAQDVSGRF
jgi:hypothetical protein